MSGVDYSHLVGKRVRVPAPRVQDRIVGRLEDWHRIPPEDGKPDLGCHSARIRRRSGSVVFIGGGFKLEPVR